MEKATWLSHPSLLDFASGVNRRKEHAQIRCIIRNQWVASNPEEWVRQLWLQYLTSGFPIGKGRIAVEKSALLQTQKRFDMVLFDKTGCPFLLGEFKAPSVPLDASHLHQLGMYNRDLGCRFILWSNGVKSWMFDGQKEEFISKLEDCLSQYL